MLDKDSRLALLTALDKQIAPQLKEAKAEARQELLDLNRESGADRKAIMVNGAKVGEVGCSYSKAKPFIIDNAKAIEYLRELGLTEEVPKSGWEEHFALVGDGIACSDTGEIVDFLAWEPSRVKTAAVRGCKPQDVLDALAPQLDGTNALALLNEGEPF